MDNQDHSIGRIQRLIDKLRHITTLVQVMPFVYSGLYVLTMILYLFAPERVRYILDTLFYVSPIVVAGLLAQSKILELCRWHKAACVLPLIPQVAVLVDRLLIPLTAIEAYISITTPALLGILLLVAAYNVFFK